MCRPCCNDSQFNKTSRSPNSGPPTSTGTVGTQGHQPLSRSFPLYLPVSWTSSPPPAFSPRRPPWRWPPRSQSPGLTTPLARPDPTMQGLKDTPPTSTCYLLLQIILGKSSAKEGGICPASFTAVASRSWCKDFGNYSDFFRLTCKVTSESYAFQLRKKGSLELSNGSSIKLKG
jgi:hypothetical protein